MDIDGPARCPDQMGAGKRKRPHDDLMHTPIPTDNIALVNPTGASQEFSSLDDHVTKRLRRQDSMDPSQSNYSKATSLHVTDLPPETLQHIFSYVHPITLGRLLSVCKLFSSLLNPTEVLPAPSSGLESASLRKQNDVWTRSRTLHLPGYPRPMDSMTEVEMWRLLRVRRCQFCHRKAKRSPSFLNTSPWNGGPGPDDVRTIWPFRVRSCGDCLRPRLRLDKDLLLSASSFLSDGLPFAFFTPSHHYVTAINLDQNQPPVNLQLKKYFYQPHIDELEDKVIEVRALGNAVVEEWSKGLETSGRARREDASRFERWEQTLAAHLHIEPGSSAFVEPPRPLGSLLPSNPSVFSDTSAPFQSRDIDMTSPGRPTSAQSSRHSGVTTATSLPVGPEMPLQPYAPAPGQVSAHPTGFSYAKPESVASESTARSRSKPRPHPQDVERLRSEKRVDIERRCQQIDPPIRPSILPFMDAYKVAMQISMPLNDFSWDFLKRQLIAQRDEAEQKEREHLAALEASHLAEEDRRHHEEQRRLDKATNDRIWAELGTPPRQKLKAYADEYIANIWDSGMAVTSAISSKFAADVLLDVVRRFKEGIVEEDNLLASRNMRLPAGSGIPDMRRLKLDDIKWVYEESVRPHTERFGKEIFLCNVCENTAKRFTFDAVIQHYAAKHTNDLSKGNQIVYWKAEWPNPPPFHTFPEAVWNRLPDSRSPMHATYGRSPHHVPVLGAHADSPEHSPDRASTWIPDEPIRLPTLYDQHCEEVASAAANALESTDHVKGMPDSVRLFVVIHCVVRSFRSKFPNEPTLSLFADCVNNKSSLRHIRDLRGLRCRACQLGTHDIHQRPQEEFWLADLLDHFQKFHIQHNIALEAAYGGPPGSVPGISSQRLHWQVDMVELPHDQIIRNLAQAPGMDASKLKVIRSVFPEIFSYAPHSFGRSEDPSLGRYYLPYVTDDRDQHGSGVLAPQPSRTGYLVAPLADPSYGLARGPAYVPASSPEWYARPREREVIYHPRREIVYFDDHREPMRGPARSETVGHRGEASVSWQSMRLNEQGGSEYYHPQGPERPYGEEEGPRKLPFRMHQAEPHVLEQESATNLRRSPTTSAVHTATSTVAGEIPQGEDPMTDAENFLNSFDPLADQEGGNGTAPMSRTVSMRRRGLNDDEAGSIVSSRLSQSGTPGQPRREGTRGRGSQTASRIDTPNESHASRRIVRDASPDSTTVQSEAPSLGNRRDDKASVYRSRTPVSEPMYHGFDNGPPANVFPAYRYETSPASSRHEVLESRHGASAPFITGSFQHSHPRRRLSPVGVRYDERPRSVRYVEVITGDGRHALEGPLSPEMPRYEYERLPPRGIRYMDEGIRSTEFRDSIAAPQDYRQDYARSGLGETRMYYAPLSSEPANRTGQRRLSTTTSSGGYAPRQPWSAEPGQGR